MKTPYYKFHPKILEKNFKHFEKICKLHLKNFKICYSVKTNSEKEVIKTLEKLNSSFEIASLQEMKQIPKNKFMVYNGPAKTKEELKYAIKNNFLINIDSFSELKKINSLKNPPKEIGIRLVLEKSKFGFGPKILPKLFEKAKKYNLKIIAIQLHQGTNRTIKQFIENLKIQNKILKPYIKQLKYLDIGGGFPDNFQLKNLSIKLEDFIKPIKDTFKNFNGEFILEPGRNLVSNSFTLISKVITIKENFNENYCILDAGINILSKMTLANFKFKQITKSTQGETKNYILAGPLLFGNDILGKYRGKLKEGDLFEIENVGAYCIPLSWEIIYKKPKIL